ncbi:hypothetical protein LIER_19952 [Lithospermum erythrorhizon]|uniref:Uncharacterized protein n=1 Tax=Lithospermum erythrorhizon TaxID=34254 RepID=A0AAV3QM79_LITER
MISLPTIHKLNNTAAAEMHATGTNYAAMYWGRTALFARTYIDAVNCTDIANSRMHCVHNAWGHPFLFVPTQKHHDASPYYEEPAFLFFNLFSKTSTRMSFPTISFRGRVSHSSSSAELDKHVLLQLLSNPYI